MPVKKERSSSFFRPLVGNAIAHAWYHRELWPIAAIAGLAGIGAGINDVLTQARLSSVLPGTDPLTLITSISFTRDVLTNIVLQSPSAIILITLLALLFGLLCGVLLSWSQHIILRASHRAIAQKKPLSLNELAKDAAHPRIVRILTIDAFIKILILNVIIITGILISGLNPMHSFFDAFFGTIFSGFTIAFAFALNVWGMLSLILVVKKNLSVTAGLGSALRMLKKHPVACTELSLLLFAATFGISLVAIVGLILIGSLSIPFFSIMISQGTLLGITFVTFCTVLLGTTWAVALAGFSTLVTYLSWTTLIESLESLKVSSTSRSAVHAKRTIGHLFG
jgi:hypothetical protein